MDWVFVVASTFRSAKLHGRNSVSSKSDTKVENGEMDFINRLSKLLQTGEKKELKPSECLRLASLNARK